MNVKGGASRLILPFFYLAVLNFAGVSLFSQCFVGLIATVNFAMSSLIFRRINLSGYPFSRSVIRSCWSSASIASGFLSEHPALDRPILLPA
ncbi:hypothetical protein SprV_0200761200 [Sparganum proliferum]